MNQNTLSIPEEFKSTLLAQTNKECANPDCSLSVDSSTAQFKNVFKPGVQHIDNYLTLCTSCAKNQQIPQTAIQAWKILHLALNGEIQTRQMEMKLGAIRNYKGLQAYFPDKYLAFPFIGGKIYLNIKESNMMLARALGIYEPEKTETITNLLKADQTFIDIGGNKGDFSLLASKLTSPKGQVLTFEPEPENCHWFEESIQLNKYLNIQLFNIALSDSNGKAQLYLGEKSGWHSLVSSQGKTDNSTIEVEMRTLDSILTESDIKQVDVIKIDVEGAEMEVLLGAESTLKNNTNLVLLLDLHPHMGVDTVAVCKFLSNRGFSIHHMKTPHEKMDKIDHTTTEILARR